MGDYAALIDTNDYLYRRKITVTEMFGRDWSDLPVKLSLNSANFNFTLAKADGSDLRVGENSNGSGILYMWVASWSQTEQAATIWFKFPQLLANETRTLYVYWGNPNDSGISDINSVDFILADGFDGPVLDTTKWDSSGSYVIADSKIRLNTNSYIRTKSSSDLCTGGTITSANTTNPSNIFDGSENTYGKMALYGGWVGYEFAEPKVLRKIRIKGHVSGGYGSGFELKASTTGVFGADAVTLYTDMDGMQVAWKEYEFANSIAYKYVRFYSRTGQRVAEIELMDDTYMVLDGIAHWAIEDGVYINESLHDTDRRYYGYSFYGPENVFDFSYYGEGEYDRKHDAVDGSLVTYNGMERGLEGNSYSTNLIAYYEPNDRVYQGMRNRATFSDYTDSWERRVRGDTRLTDFHIIGRDSSSAPYVYIDWVVVREYFGDKDLIIDTSDLYIEHETVYPQPIDFVEYDPDVTSIGYYHESNFGGDPYRLSDNLTDSTFNSWYSNEAAASEDYVDLIIDFGRLKKNLVARKYIHYDNGHVRYLNASKLSDSDVDINLNNYFESTTTSGYIAINFGNDVVNINCLTIKAVESNLDGMVKNFIFECSDVDPRFSSEDQWKILYIGQFEKVSGWQSIYFVNDRNYRYYKLRFVDTYGGNAALQEWGMFEYNELLKKRVVSQLRLYPVCFSSQEIYFPKKITLCGSNNMVDWDILTSSDVKTYTPFSGYTNWWQRYSFDNIKAYWCYKLTCKGNWNNGVGKMAIAEWEMCEKYFESYTYRILQGATNNFLAIWALSDTTFDEGEFFVVNEGLNVISNDKLSKYTEIAGVVMDLNVL